MEESSPRFSNKVSESDKTTTSQDVENLLQKPLLGHSESRKTESPVSSPSQRNPPDLNLSKASEIKPPYHSDNDYSILFKAVVAVVVYFAVGIACFYYAPDDYFGINTKSFIDTLYFCVVTLTTVGYGDLVPRTEAGKLFVCAYIFVGFGLVGALVSGAANYIVELQEKILVQSIKKKQQQDYELPEEMDCRNAEWKVFVSGSLVVALVVAGIVFLVLVEGMTFIDAIYCVCVTVTTLGYGDDSFQTATGRLFASVWILTSTVCVAQFFLYIAEMRTGARQLQLAHWVLHRRTTQSDLQAADLDGDGLVSAPEFVLFKLKELGKVDEEDVAGILSEFHQLDYDHSGNISMEDLRVAQA